MADERPTYDELTNRIKRLEALFDFKPGETPDLKLDSLPITQLMRLLEQQWSPDRSWFPPPDNLSSFLSLIGTTNRKVNYGVTGTIFAFNAVGDEMFQTIAHGLGVTPGVAIAIQAPSSHTSLGVRMTCHIQGVDATNIGVYGFCTNQPIAPTVAVPAYWIAIG